MQTTQARFTSALENQGRIFQRRLMQDLVVVNAGTWRLVPPGSMHSERYVEFQFNNSQSTFRGYVAGQTGHEPFMMYLFDKAGKESLDDILEAVLAFLLGAPCHIRKVVDAKQFLADVKPAEAD
jgi:enamine deaminase RidA (YjgF/YER057c/UK114 family)